MCLKGQIPVKSDTKSVILLEIATGHPATSIFAGTGNVRNCWEFPKYYGFSLVGIQA